MASPDFYELLGIAKDATFDEVRQAYERAAMAPGSEGRSGLAEAFHTLSDPHRRVVYDQQLYVARTLPSRARRSEGRTAGASASSFRSMRPRDAATLVIIDRASEHPRILMGRRRDDVAFMPGKYVFPGGRVDKEDRLVEAADELSGLELRRLLHDMKGSPSEARARAIALAAVRETFEEAGIVIGAAAPPASQRTRTWSEFFALGFRPRLAPLTLFARAITPPGRTRRYDTRFFCVDAEAIAHRSTMSDGELSGLHWMTFDEARALDLPHITRVILEDLTDRLKVGSLLDPGAPVPYYHHKHGTFRRDVLPGE